MESKSEANGIMRNENEKLKVMRSLNIFEFFLFILYFVYVFFYI